MATLYPSAIDNETTLINDHVDDDITAGDHAPLHNNLSDAIISIETVLGVNPNGSYDDIAQAITASVVTSPVASQVVRATGDVVGLAVRAAVAQNTANVFEMRLVNNAVAAFIDKNGAFSAQSLFVGGSPLASTHLWDSGTLARLASPAFTGAPTAPTPSVGDNSTKIATTAFVTAALSAGVPTGVMLPYAGSVAPAGYVIAVGQLVDGTTPTYSALWTALGLTHGGSGQSSFRLPDPQGRAIFGKAGAAGHSDVQVLGANDNLGVGSRRPKHRTSISDPGHQHIVGREVVSLTPGGTAYGIRGNGATQDSPSLTAVTGITAGPQTGAEPVDTVPYLVLNYIIKL